jgi:pimeloyl-ACP methyl ester carboxylesterase
MDGQAAPPTADFAPSMMIEKLPDLVNADAALVRRGRLLTVDILLEIGPTPYYVSIERGRIARLERGPVTMRSWSFAIRGSEHAWRQFWLPVPPPHFHDLFALAKRGEFRIEGDLYPLMAHLPYFKGVLAAPGKSGLPDLRIQDTAPARGGALMPARLDPIVGRYLHVTLQGRPHRLYFEEAGQGIPLVCLHTAGADGRQFRHMMTDAAITDAFRVIAFDLPWHGKSTPPDGWHDEEYRLTTASYTEAIRTFCAALELARPVVLGCSIGGRIVLNLAVHHAAEFRALIGLESAAFQPPWYDTDWLHRPDVHGGEVCAGLVSGLIAPQSPEPTRCETLWHYLQSGPGVFKGDLYFYRVDADLRDQMRRIDTRICPLYLLTGEYDFSCTPEDTIRTAEQIPGAEVVVMKEVGHFPMSENPQQFRRYILPVLERIRNDSRGNQ